MNNNLGRRQYEAAHDGGSYDGKGLHMGERPYLWREENPVDPVLDTPCENFVPTPTIHTGDDSSPAKKALKIGLLVAFIALVIYAGIAMLIENPALFGLGEVSFDKFFRLQL